MHTHESLIPVTPEQKTCSERASSMSRSKLLASQYLLHADLLHLESYLLIEPHSAVVAGPDIERHVIAAPLPRVTEHKFIERAAYMQSARRLIHTEIVYVKRLYIGQA